jgi:hypothetical protein
MTQEVPYTGTQNVSCTGTLIHIHTVNAQLYDVQGAVFLTMFMFQLTGMLVEIVNNHPGPALLPPTAHHLTPQHNNQHH